MTSPARPIVSVVIPCFNRTGYLADAIKSAVSHDFPCEVVVVDDGSSDGACARVLSRFGSVRRVTQRRPGVADARNRGVAETCGDFMIFLDAADRLLPGAIDTAARALSARPDCVMAYGRSVMMGPDATISPMPEPAAVLSGHHAALLRTNLIPMSAMAILRRDAIERAGGFAQGFDGATDYDLYLRLTSEHAICDHGRLVAACRQHVPSMSSPTRLLRDTLTVMRRNRPADPLLQSAWLEGYRGWQDFYGIHIVDEIRMHLLRRETWSALAKAIALGRLAPNVAARELHRGSIPMSCISRSALVDVARPGRSL